MSYGANPLKNRNIEITDPLFGSYVNKVSRTIIPYQWGILNDLQEGTDPTHCLRNFRIAAGETVGEYSGIVYQDTDAYKWLETVAYCIDSGCGDEFIVIADETIALIGRAQQADGYLNTYYTVAKPGRRWTNLVEGHELYSAGHLIEAAVAYHTATGKTALLTTACRFADLICRTFGPGENQIKGYPGHQEIELALVRLYRVTGEKRYLDCARHFIDQRGRSPNYFENEIKDRGEDQIFDEFKNYDLKYSQSHMQPVQQRTAEGHAVRAMYMYSAMADLALEQGDPDLKEACEALWQNVTQKRMFITGGIGSSEKMERFTVDYDLPNDRAYCETCASIGLMMFGQRMASLTHNGGYYDVVERALHNTVLAGISAQGNRYFYVNPLEVWPDNCIHTTSMAHVKPVRQEWFHSACCPTNVARTLASLGQYIFAQDDSGLYINQFISAKAKAETEGGAVDLILDSNYMKDGTVKLSVQTARETPFLIKIRIPGFAGPIQFSLNNHTAEPFIKDGYACFDGLWYGSHEIVMIMDAAPHFEAANIEVREDAGKVALVKGPFVYCLEETDNGKNLASLYVSPDTAVKEAAPISGLPGELPVLKYAGSRMKRTLKDRNLLYGSSEFEKEPTGLTAVPYCLWCNRDPGEMMVWQKISF